MSSELTPLNNRREASNTPSSPRERELLQEIARLKDRVSHLEAEVRVWIDKADDYLHEWHAAEAKAK